MSAESPTQIIPPGAEGDNRDPAPPGPDPDREFEPMMPEFRAGGTIIIGEGELNYAHLEHKGVRCKVRALRTRHILAIGRILTGSTRPINLQELFQPFAEANKTDDESDRWTAWASLITSVFLTVPHSEEEFIDLLANVVDPVDRLNEEELPTFVSYLRDPSPGDTISVLRQIVANEAPRAAELGKVFANMMPDLENLRTSPEESPPST